MHLLVDILNDAELEAIQRVSVSEDMRFHQLVNLAGLDPTYDFRFANLRQVDFRGADLRGFDFTGADLRFSARDSATMIDDSTLLGDAKVMWLEAEPHTSTVNLMLAVERAASSGERKTAIQSLMETPPNPAHLSQWVLELISREDDEDRFFDFASMLGTTLTATQSQVLVSHLRRLVQRKSKAAEAKKRRVTANVPVASRIIERMSESPSPAIRRIYGEVLKQLATMKDAVLSTRNPHVEVTLTDVSAALRDIEASRELPLGSLPT